MKLSLSLAAVLALAAGSAAAKRSSCKPGASWSRHQSSFAHPRPSAPSTAVAVPTSAQGGIAVSSALASPSVPAPASASASAPASAVTVSSEAQAATSTVVVVVSSGAQPAPSSAAAVVASSAKPAASTAVLSSSAKPAPTHATSTSKPAAPPSNATSKSSTAAPSATPAPVTAPAAGSSGTKRGLAFNDAGATAPFGAAAGWAYNWDSAHAGALGGALEYVPMLWGASADHTAQWAKNANAAIAAGATHLLGFNEPDLGAQSNLSPEQAAAAWKTHMQPFAGKAKLVSPAVTNGGAPMGTAWLDAFFKACAGCTVDAVAVHIYDSASNAAYFKNYIADVGTKYGKPVWVTEFGASGSVADQQAFLEDMVPFLDGLASVERYAYFGDFENTFVSGSQLLPLGQTYASA